MSVVLRASVAAALLAAPLHAAPAREPAALLAEIRSARLDPAAAVAVSRVKLEAGIGTLRLEEGVLVPATPAGGRVVEMVFRGSGRIVVEPPDAIEAGQLELFTGDGRLDEPFTEAVLVLAMDGAVDALLRRPAAPLAADAADAAEALFAAWKAGPQRRLLNVDAGVFMDAAGDPLYQGYFAAWCRGGELEDFLYLVEPEAQEQVTVGRFVPLETSARERRRLRRAVHREQRRGRLIGLDLEDLGQWDTWLSASLRAKDGKPLPGTAAFEPERYTLEVSIAEKGGRLSGNARLDLRSVVRSRNLALRLSRDLEVARVTDGAGAPLFFLRSGGDLNVFLPEVALGEAVAVVVEYAGNLLHRDGRAYELLDTQDWYPRAGTLDRARYDVTFRWPRRLELLASGTRAGGGERGESRWERRTLDLPAAGFVFEIGHFDTQTVAAGHVTVTLAFDAASKKLVGQAERREIAETVTGSLAYYEELFGPYPLDHLTVVTSPRSFSQAMLGFVTLSNLMMADLDWLQALLGLEDRRTIVAHEIAHQWWGHMVGWASYRDQWLSEALANYAALLYAKHKLEWRDRARIGPTTGWQRVLTETLDDGRPVEAVGPVVLGARLASSRSDAAYQAIVYYKGAVILDMLARSVGEESFARMLRETARVVAHRALSTEDLFTLFERMTGGELDWFAGQYVYSTGLPEVYYTYRFEKREAGWAVAGTARQQAPYRFRYRVVKTAAGYDVGRERLEQAKVADSALVVPVELALYDPRKPPPGKARPDGREQANLTGRAHIMIRGATSEFDIPVEQEPKAFWLDRHEEVFGRFFDESREPKRVLWSQGLDAAAGGDGARAAELFARALAAPLRGENEDEGAFDGQERRLLNGQIHLGLARLHLDQGRAAEAQAEFERADRTLEEGMGGWIGQEMKVLQSRLDVRRGAYDRAFKRLRRGLASGAVDGTEGQVLLAIAAKALGKGEEYERAAKTARASGADLAALAP
ncbi:MAG TPA: M1 family aminopeptidase [Thermoanaerobaculia bacterium]|nr:M1 family aminopeptidase [Thermoanaerobaculia bacterium]